MLYRTHVISALEKTREDFARFERSLRGEVGELAARLAEMEELRAVADFPGAGAAGGLGAALAALGAELARGAALVLDMIGWSPQGFDLVVTGEGTVDGTSTRGKAPGEVARRCAATGVACLVFGGRVEAELADLEAVPLSGDPARAWDDLVALGAAAARPASGRA
jgi:glycerate kinase